jgi:hypothetical protein
MKYIVTFILIISAQAFAQFPAGRYYTIFPDKAAIITIDSVSLSLQGGNPIFDNTRKTIVLDSAQDGHTVSIVKIYSSSKTSWLLIGKVTDSARTIFALLDLIAVDPQTLELNFRKDEFASREEAEQHIGDTTAVFGFRFMNEEKVKRLMSLKPIKELTSKDMIAVYRATSDSVEALSKRFKDQPEAAFFAMMIRPMQITSDELATRGYNPLAPNAEIEAVLDKLKLDPEVKKVLDEIEAKQNASEKE